MSATAELVRAAFERPDSFYARRLERAGVAPDRADDAWDRIPATRRDELVADQLAHLPHGSRRRADAEPPIRAGATGSGADLLVLTWTRRDLARERAAGVRTLRGLGIEPGMRVANALPGALTTPGSLLFGDVVDDLGALDVPLGAVRDAAAAAAAWKLIDRVEANVIVVDAAAAEPLFAAYPGGDRPWWRGVVSLVESAPPVPLPDDLGFRGWQRFWLAIPEAASFLAGSCGAGSLHFDSDAYVELHDLEAGRPVDRGTPGRIVVTPYARDQILLRYVSDVKAREVDCACGQPGWAAKLSV